jgi:hypothetical protein
VVRVDGEAADLDLDRGMSRGLAGLHAAKVADA